MERPGRERKSRLSTPWIRRVIFAFIIIALYVAMSMYQSTGTVSGPAPAIQARTIAGQPFDLDGFRGSPALVHFWASWCGACRMMEGNVEDVASDSDLQVITVAVRSGGSPVVRAYLEEAALRIPAIADPRGAIAASYGVTTLPTSFYLNATGAVVTTEIGMTSALGMRVRLWWSGR